ncbi:hypothetical protein [Streptomyces albogriseolus]|uniref:hypothetical protein n=1 Tax=Streptomyces albogriseolus TaxID=1887 RepID=UPI0036FED246
MLDADESRVPPTCVLRAGAADPVDRASGTPSSRDSRRLRKQISARPTLSISYATTGVVGLKLFRTDASKCGVSEVMPRLVEVEADVQGLVEAHMETLLLRLNS